MKEPPFLDAAMKFTHEDQSDILEAACWALLYHREALSDRLDVSDEYLVPLAAKLNSYLNR